MALDLFPSSTADPQPDKVDNITKTTTTTNNKNWPFGIPTITLSPSPDPQRMPPPAPSPSQDNSVDDSDSSSSESGALQGYGGRSKSNTATGGDVAAVGVNAQEREIRTKNDLHPYVQTLSLADLDSCVALENAAFPEEERCSREKVREPALYLFFNFQFLSTVCVFSLFFEKKKKSFCFLFQTYLAVIWQDTDTLYQNRNVEKTFPPALFVLFINLHPKRPHYLNSLLPTLLSHTYSSSTDSTPAPTCPSASSLPFPRPFPLSPPHPQPAPLSPTNPS